MTAKTRRYYYRCVYGRYGKHQITSYFMVTDQSVLKLDTHHKKMSHIKPITWKGIYWQHRKRITAAEFQKQMKKFDMIAYLDNHHK